MWKCSIDIGRMKESHSFNWIKMGCCCLNRKLSTPTSYLLSKPSQSHKPRDTVTQGNLLILLLDLRQFHEAKRLLPFISRTDALDPSNIPEQFRSQLFPRTIGGFSLQLLSDLAWESPASTAQILSSKAPVFISLLNSKHPDTKYFTLLLIHYTLMQPTALVKQQLVSHDIYSVVLPLFHSPEVLLRRLASIVAASIYREFPAGQRSFLNKGGASSLLELIREEEHSEEVVKELLERLKELLLVPLT